MLKHEGLSTHRLEPEADNPREVVFAERWAEYNRSVTGLTGTTLDWLLHAEDNEATTQHEATVAATVVQWLGSPVGFAFLTECLGEICRRC